MLKSYFLIAGLALLTACTVEDQKEVAQDPGSSTIALAGTTWRLASINGSAVMRPAAGATLNFNDTGTEAGGTGTCNTFGTVVTSEGEALSFGPIIATERACLPDTRMLAEGAYFQALRQTARFETDGTSLALFDADGREVLGFETTGAAPVETDLVGTRWSLGDLEGTPAFGLAHIAFDENGELNGQGPCNGLAGDYRLGSGRTVEIMPRKTTRCFCDDFDRELQFLDALRRVENWRIDGERLLLGAGEATLMILEIEREAPEPLRDC